MGSIVKPNAELKKVLKASGSARASISVAATHEIAKALELPLRQGIMSGDILEGIFEPIPLEDGASPEFPLDFLTPGTEKEYVAYTIPNVGYIPQKHIESDYIMVPIYPVGNSIDWELRYARNARWDVVSRALGVFESGFVKKANDEGMHTILGAGLDRNIMVYDADAQPGQFTKRLISLAKIIMRRNAGGNSSITNRGRLTDVFLSPEGLEDIRNWGVDQVDELTRREIYLAADGTINRIYGVNLHDLDELGDEQEYQDYFLNTLGGTLASGDTELAIGLDLSNRDAFIMPVRQPLEVFEDPVLHRSQRAGIYGWTELGFAVLSNSRVLLMSY